MFTGSSLSIQHRSAHQLYCTESQWEVPMFLAKRIMSTQRLNWKSMVKKVQQWCQKNISILYIYCLQELLPPPHAHSHTLENTYTHQPTNKPTNQKIGCASASANKNCPLSRKPKCQAYWTPSLPPLYRPTQPFDASGMSSMSSESKMTWRSRNHLFLNKIAPRFLSRKCWKNECFISLVV